MKMLCSFKVSDIKFVSYLWLVMFFYKLSNSGKILFTGAFQLNLVQGW